MTFFGPMQERSPRGDVYGTASPRLAYYVIYRGPPTAFRNSSYLAFPWLYSHDRAFYSRIPHFDAPIPAPRYQFRGAIGRVWSSQTIDGVDYRLVGFGGPQSYVVMLQVINRQFPTVVPACLGKRSMFARRYNRKRKNSDIVVYRLYATEGMALYCGNNVTIVSRDSGESI